MKSIRSLLGLSFAVLALLCVSACATTPSVSPAEMAAIRTGQQSAIIMSYREFGGLYAATVRFVNVDTRRIYSVSMHGGDNWVNAGPDMVAVPPGRYRVLSGNLYGYQVTGNLPLLAYWFDEFDVRSGEVVNIGTLTIRDINVRSLPGMTDQVFNALFTLDTAQHNTYYIYNVDYSDEARVQHMLESKYPELGVTPIQRPLHILFDSGEFEHIIVEAYAPHADGTLPTPQEAQARLGVTLEQFVQQSRAAGREASAAPEVGSKPN